MRRILLPLLLAASAAAAANIDGQLDTSFGDDGRSLFGFLESDTLQLRAVARYPSSGRIWMFADDAEDAGAIYIARMQADGTPDSGFGPAMDGRRRIVLPAALIPGIERTSIAGAMIQTDGKPLVYGALAPMPGDNGVFPGFVCRLNAAGGLDSTFSGDGCQLLRSFAASEEQCEVRDLAPASGGALVAVGNCSGTALRETPFVAKLVAGGGFDTEFAGGAGVTLPQSPFASVQRQHVAAVAVRPDDRIVVLGEYLMASSNLIDLELGVSQFDAGGSPDPEFNQVGFQIVSFDLGGDNHDRARDLALDAQGRALLLGQARSEADARTVALLARLTPQGLPDDSFGNNGQRVDALDDTSGYFGEVVSLELDAQQRPLIAAQQRIGHPAARDLTGTDFWLGFTAVLPPEFDGQIVIRGDVATTGTITGATIQPIPFAVAPGVETNITIPKALFAVLYDNGRIDERTLHITAQAPISVMAKHGRVYSMDSLQLLPTRQLGLAYRVLSRGDGLGVGSNLTVVATQDNTTVTIRPTATSDGHVAGVPFNIALNAGQAYALWTDQRLDLSGTGVHADKPVALFAGHSCATVPDDLDYCDQSHEQMPPIDRLGTVFVTAPSPQRIAQDVVRVLSFAADTVLRVDGVHVATLDLGETYELTPASRVVLRTSKPAMVGQMMAGCIGDGQADENGNCPGDPFLFLVPPIEQWARRHHVAANSPYFLNQTYLHWIRIAARDVDTASVRIDGQPLPPDSFASVGDGLAYAQVPFASGTAVVTADGDIGVAIHGMTEGEAYAHGSAPVRPETTHDGNDLVLRLRVDGSRDPEFGDGGRILVDHRDYFGTTEASIDRPVRAVSDGSGVIVASASRNGASQQDLLLAYRIEAGTLFKDSFD